MSTRAADLLLVVGVDVSNLHRELALIERQLGNSSQTAATGLATGLNAAGRGAAALTEQVDRGRKAIIQQIRAGEELGQVFVTMNRRVRQEQDQTARETMALINRRRREEESLARDTVALTRRQAAEEYQRARDIIAMTGRARKEQEQLGAGMNAMMGRYNRETATAINQLRQVNSLLDRAAQRPGAVSAGQLAPLQAAQTGLLRGQPVDPVAWARLRGEMDGVRASLSSQQGAWEGFQTRLQRVSQFIGAVTLAYGAMTLAFRGTAELLEIDRGLSMVAASLERGQNRMEALSSASELVRIAMTKFGLEAGKANEIVVGLSRAVDNDATLMRAMLEPALSLTTLKEIDMAGAVKILVGLYHVYGSTMEGAVTPTEKMAAITDLLHVTTQMATGDVIDSCINNAI